MNIEELSRIWPGARATAERQFPLLNSVQLTITDVTVNITSPNQAIVSCRMTYTYNWKRAGAQPRSSTQTGLSLQKRERSWVIVNR